MNLCIGFLFLKIINFKKCSKKNILFIIITSIVLSLVEFILKKYLVNIFSTTIIYFVYNIILSKITKNKFGYSLLITILSVSIAYVLFSISIFIVYISITLFNLWDYSNPVNFVLAAFLQSLLIYILFKLRRFKNGFPFIINKRENDYIDTLILIISVIIIFTYFLTVNHSNIEIKYLFSGLILFALIMSIIIQKSFIIYQKQKLLEKTLKDYEQEIAESKNKFEILLKEKNNLVKANHEFYHRQQALHLKLDNLIKNNKTLFKEEYGSIIDRIDTLSKEYTTTISNTETQAILPKTNISEIDDMFIYMQNECKKNNIDFTLRLTSDIYQLINNIIPKNKFETLIGDLIRNSIIAINYSSNKNRAIMIILGIKDNTYEFSIYDTGIEFKIETLSKLGLEHATTHADTGGTGIGFITTFETLKYCNASLIITEFSDRNFEYTKSITIKFDSKNNYIIETYRADQFPENQRVKIYPTNIKI